MPDLHTLARDTVQAREEFLRQMDVSMQCMKDFGLDYEVAVRFVRGFLDEDPDPYDPGEGDFWHGTHTGGLVVSSSYGAAPGARLVVTRCVPGYYEDLVQALQFCLDQGCRVIATGAGAASRVSLGTAVFGGMLLATIGGLIITPYLYYMVARMGERKGGESPPAEPSTETQPLEAGAES